MGLMRGGKDGEEIKGKGMLEKERRETRTALSGKSWLYTRR
jgi:hypothetical protein